MTKAMTYGYTGGRLTTVTLPSGQVITCAYTNGRINSVKLGTTTILNGVLYEPFGPVRQWTWGNATLAVRTHDQNGKLTQVDSASLRTYTYDDALRITGIADAANSGLSQTYGYDPLDRLTSAAGSSLNQGWTYDANGSRLTQIGTTASTHTIATDSNRIASVSGALTRTYAYGSSGHVLSDGNSAFTYNDAGRMSSATKAGVTTTYAYNALGQRVRKTTGGISAYFVYDEAGRLIGEYNNAGGLIQETVWMGEIPVATLRRTAVASPSSTSIPIISTRRDASAALLTTSLCGVGTVIHSALWWHPRTPTAIRLCFHITSDLRASTLIRRAGCTTTTSGTTIPQLAGTYNLIWSVLRAVQTLTLMLRPTPWNT